MGLYKGFSSVVVKIVWVVLCMRYIRDYFVIGKEEEWTTGRIGHGN